MAAARTRAFASCNRSRNVGASSLIPVSAMGYDSQAPKRSSRPTHSSNRIWVSAVRAGSCSLRTPAERMERFEAHCVEDDVPPRASSDSDECVLGPLEGRPCFAPAQKGKGVQPFGAATRESARLDREECVNGVVQFAPATQLEQGPRFRAWLCGCYGSTRATVAATATYDTSASSSARRTTNTLFRANRDRTLRGVAALRLFDDAFALEHLDHPRGLRDPDPGLRAQDRVTLVLRVDSLARAGGTRYGLDWRLL
jgi:hypothetical protein